MDGMDGMDGMDLTRRVVQILDHYVHKVDSARGLGLLSKSYRCFYGERDTGQKNLASGKQESWKRERKETLRGVPGCVHQEIASLRSQ
jgi:hypothetical protein